MSDQQNEVNEIKAKAWNDCITPRLEAIRGWFHSDTWSHGVGAYLSYQKNQLQKKLNAGLPNQRDEDKLRGQIVMLEELLDLPGVIDNHIDTANKQKNTPKGNAGY